MVLRGLISVGAVDRLIQHFRVVVILRMLCIAYAVRLFFLNNARSCTTVTQALPRIRYARYPIPQYLKPISPPPPFFLLPTHSTTKHPTCPPKFLRPMFPQRRPRTTSIFCSTELW